MALSAEILLGSTGRQRSRIWPQHYRHPGRRARASLGRSDHASPLWLQDHGVLPRRSRLVRMDCAVSDCADWMCEIRNGGDPVNGRDRGRACNIISHGWTTMTSLLHKAEDALKRAGNAIVGEDQVSIAADSLSYWSKS